MLIKVKEKSSTKGTTQECVFFYSEVTCKCLLCVFISVKTMWFFPSHILQQHILCFRRAVTRDWRYARKMNGAGFLNVTLRNGSGACMRRLSALVLQYTWWNCGCNFNRLGAWKCLTLQLQGKVFHCFLC